MHALLNPKQERTQPIALVQVDKNEPTADIAPDKVGRALSIKVSIGASKTPTKLMINLKIPLIIALIIDLTPQLYLHSDP